MRASELEGKVLDAVRGLYADPEAFLRRVEIDVQRVKDEASDHGRRLTALEQRLEALAAEEMRVVEIHRKGYIDDTVMLAQLDQVRAERQDVEGELKLAQHAAGDVDWVTQAAEWFGQLMASIPGPVVPFVDERTGEQVEPTDDEWRERIKAVVDKVVVEPDGAITLEGPFGSRAAVPSSKSTLW
jgi:hypothetical protein